ncbi:MAG: GntR family transcriptional regulator [Spirochaetota bacterium]|nr:MAG: GntR family transcriptional regulator [Spirochaetota bacterium]
MSKEHILNDTMIINKESPIPYYYQLKMYIKGEIDAGKLEPQQKIPSEAELCGRFDISRTVVRQAIKDLQNEGYLNTEKGKGTFVARPKIVGGLVQSLTGFYEDMVKRGFKVSTEIIRQELEGASQKVAGALRISVGTSVVVITRLRKLNGEPSVFVSTYIPEDLCPDLLHEDIKDQSLYTILENKYGITIHKGHRYIGVSLANEYEAQLLHIEVGSPLIELDSTSYLEDGRPLEYFHALHRGDRTKFEVELFRLKSLVK